MKFVQQAWYWRLAVLRVFVYMASTFIATFLMLTEEFSTNQWNEMGEFVKRRLYLACLSPALIAFVAFMDSTMGELRKAQADSEKNITTVTTETTGPDAREAEAREAQSKTD